MAMSRGIRSTKPTSRADGGTPSDGPRATKPPLGRLLETFRAAKSISTRELAKELGVHYSLINNIEWGKKTLTEAVLKGIADVLGLYSEEIEQFRQYATYRNATTDIEVDPLLAVRGLYVSASRLMERECRTDIRSVWVLDPAPLELNEKKSLDKVVQNLQEQKKEYVYFLEWPDVAGNLRAVLEGRTSSDLVDQLVTFVTVPRQLHRYFFNPVKAIWHTDTGKRLGVWAFRGPGGTWIDGGFLMDEPTLRELIPPLLEILYNLKQSTKYSIPGGPLTFEIVGRHPANDAGS